MRARVLIPALLVLLMSASAEAAVQIEVDKDTQTMTVAVDGVTRYRWPVSSGLPAHETPNGVHKAFRMEEDHYSREWDEAPMPHSIFFTKRGHAIHGTDSVNRLGNPASHGCVRLSRANAATLFELVKAEGVLNTTVTLTGSSQVALMRGPQRRNDVAARTATPQADEPRIYDGNARTLPPPQQITPHVTDTGGYYDEYGRWVPGGGQNYRRSTEAQSPYAGQQPQPYAQQPPRYYGQQPYQQPRYYYRQQPYQQPYAGQYGNPYYAQPRTYYQPQYENYGN